MINKADIVAALLGLIIYQRSQTISKPNNTAARHDRCVEERAEQYGGDCEWGAQHSGPRGGLSWEASPAVKRHRDEVTLIKANI